MLFRSGYFALGLACGILAFQSALNPFQAFAMSILVFAGSGQFIGIAMMAQGAALFSIGLTVFIVNLRCLLFSSTLFNHYKSNSKLNLLAFAHGVTDENFAVNLNCFESNIKPPWSNAEALGLNTLTCLVWAVSNAIGCFGAEHLNPPTELVSYLLIAMFLGIWVNYLTSKPMIITGIFSGILSCFFLNYVPYKLHIVLATLIASALACYLYEKYAGGINGN